MIGHVFVYYLYIDFASFCDFRIEFWNRIDSVVPFLFFVLFNACPIVEYECSDDWWKCRDGKQCIPEYEVCEARRSCYRDGGFHCSYEADCNDGSDEWRETCQGNTSYANLVDQELLGRV